MAATVKKEFLIKKIEAEKLTCYEVTDGRAKIAENQDCDSPTQCIEELEEIFESVEDAIVVVKVSDRSKKLKAKGGPPANHYEYRIRLKESAASGIGGTNQTLMGMMNQIYDLRLQLEKKELEKEKTELLKRLEKLEEDKGNPMMEKALTMLGTYLSGGQKATIGVAGTDDPHPDEDQVKKQMKVRKALSRLNKIDPDLPDSLTLLADFAEKKPEEYRRFVPMIRSMI